MLKLNYKSISSDTIEIMQKSLTDSEDYYQEAVYQINNILPSCETFILNNANSCILTVVESLEDSILIADMGGWNGFKKTCELLSKKYYIISTDDGIINIENLIKYIKEYDAKSLYITSLAGYSAIQPIKEIFDICNTYNVMLILDISGTVGYDKINQYCDVQIASTGSPKIVNVENGGFINDISGKIKLNKHLLKILKADNTTCAGISNEIKKAPEILKKTIKANTYFKNTLSDKLKNHHDYNIIHKENIGINTIIQTKSKKKAKELSYNIRKNIEVTPNKSIITTGPNYNRIKKASVIIEIKNINPDSLTKENLDKLADIIEKEINRLK